MDVGAAPERASSRLHDRIVAAMFVLVIALPLASNLTGHDGADPGAENRELAAFPTLAPTWRSIAAFGNGVGHWFEDHFGFRAALVRWYGESRLFLLDVSPSAAVLKGRAGWFFYADDKGLEDFADDPPMSMDEVLVWRESLARTRDYLASSRISFVFTVAPDKHVIYPEDMPTTIRRVAPVSRTDQLIVVARDAGVAAVDLRPALFEAKTRERLDQRTDTHWNDRGALVAYQQIIDAERLQDPRVPRAWTRADFDDAADETDGMDLAGMMGLTRVLREVDLKLIPKRPRLARVVEPAGAAPTAEEGRLVTEIPGSTLPRALIVRDSFTSRLVPFLSEHFSRAVYLWQNDFIPDDVQHEHPDVVIQEIVGRHLYNFVPSPSLVPLDERPGG
jgi:hypothetical protein